MCEFISWVCLAICFNHIAGYFEKYFITQFQQQGKNPRLKSRQCGWSLGLNLWRAWTWLILQSSMVYPDARYKTPGCHVYVFTMWIYNPYHFKCFPGRTVCLVSIKGHGHPSLQRLKTSTGPASLFLKGPPSGRWKYFYHLNGKLLKSLLE